MKKQFAAEATAALMLAAKPPAFANKLAVDGGEGVEFDAIAQAISGGFVDVERSQFGEATADASGDSAASHVSRSQGFVFVQYNSAPNDF